MEKLVLYDFIEYDIFEIEDSIEITGNISEKNLFKEELKFVSPLNFKLIINRKGYKFLFNVNIETTLRLSCDRCLEFFNFPVKTYFNFLYIYNKDNIEYINDKFLNIRDLIIGDIYLNIPFKKLCSEICKGLCPVCGANLNITTCNCKRDYNVNPFSQLKIKFK